MSDTPEISRAPGFIDHVPSAAELGFGVEQAVVTPAQELGLVDGGFTVHRSDGYRETGWSVRGIHATAEGERVAEIVKPPNEAHPTHELTKYVKVDKLLGWQPQAEHSSEGLNPEVDPLAAREAELMAELAALEAPFSQEEAFELWAYAAGVMNKAEAQKRGDGASSTAEGQRAGQAYSRLSPAGKEAASEYLGVMQTLERVRAKRG